uniref:Uncharacterized protein n=1 Tax=Mycena chlorophos TaxID=658473 RepID=A0ABQ0LJA1_MYCCL|nr:predicted protein [Mycena chlorophos]
MLSSDDGFRVFHALHNARANCQVQTSVFRLVDGTWGRQLWFNISGSDFTIYWWRDLAQAIAPSLITAGQIRSGKQLAPSNDAMTTVWWVEDSHLRVLGSFAVADSFVSSAPDSFSLTGTTIIKALELSATSSRLTTIRKQTTLRSESQSTMSTTSTAGVSFPVEEIGLVPSGGACPQATARHTLFASCAVRTFKPATDTYESCGSVLDPSTSTGPCPRRYRHPL